MLIAPFTLDEETVAQLHALRANRNVEGIFSFVARETSDEDKEKFIAYAHARNRPLLAGLNQAITVVKAVAPSFDFFDKILPELIKSVLQLKDNAEESALRVLRRGEAGTVSYERTTIFAFLAAALFRLIPEFSTEEHGLSEEELGLFGSLSFAAFLLESTRIGSQRLACLLLYFHMVIEEPERLSGRVSFERLHGPFASMPDLTSLDDVAVVPKLSRLPFLSVGDQHRIEDVDADGHVDFANKQVHIGSVIASATQEEVLFSIRPECFLGIVLFEQLADDEAALIHGAQRYCNYKGYLNSFTLTGPYQPSIKETHPPAVVIIDAHMNRNDSQFDEGVVERDIFKAYLGFKGVPLRCGAALPSTADALDRMPVISTGGWGCGIFRGDQFLKFVQQSIAASMAQCRLVYSSFGNAERAETLKLLMMKLQSTGTTVREMMMWIDEYRLCDREETDFELFLLSKFVRQTTHRDDVNTRNVE